MSKEEAEKIRAKMVQTGIRNKSAYLRKMALDGFVVKLDLTDVKELVRLLRICSNNLNQYAKVANAVGHIDAGDMKDLRMRLDELIVMAKQIMRRLAAIV